MLPSGRFMAERGQWRRRASARSRRHKSDDAAPIGDALLLSCIAQRAAMLPPPVLLQSGASALGAIVEHGNRLLCSPWITALQFHGIYLVLLLATLWVLAGKARLRELQRQRRGSLGRAPGPKGSSRGSLASMAAQQEVRPAWQLAPLGGGGNHRRLPLTCVAAAAAPPAGLPRCAGRPPQAAARDPGAAREGLPQPQHGQLAVHAQPRLRWVLPLPLPLPLQLPASPRLALITVACLLRPVCCAFRLGTQTTGLSLPLAWPRLMLLVAAVIAAAGGLEFVFVLEDKADPAHAVITALARELEASGGSSGGASSSGGGSLGSGSRSVRIHSAGFAEHTSQKIHK